MGSCVSTQSAYVLDAAASLGPATPAIEPYLPNEILSTIFTYVAQIEPIRSIHDMSPSEGDDDTYYGRLGWTRLCGVCRHWRDLLVGMSSLWAGIVFHLPPEPASLALSRAKEAALNIRVPFMSIPPHQGRLATWKKRLTRFKSSDQPPTDRERLLSLAVENSCRMGQFFAEDLTARDFRAIFSHTSFDQLRVLVLKRSVDWLWFIYEDLSLSIVAPRVEQAHLHVSLPITHGEGTGLKLSLPALLDLELATSTPIPWSRDIDTLRWVPALIRGAPKLKSLVMDLPSELPVDWQRLFGGEPVHLSALRATRLSGTVMTNLDQFFSLIVAPHPPHISFTEDSLMSNSDSLQFMSRYGNAIAQSLSVHPLDSIIVSRETRVFDDMFDLCAFSHDELPGPYLMSANFIYNACMRSHYCAAFSARMTLGVAADALGPFASFHPAPNAIKHLILDEYVTDEWAELLHRYLHSFLRNVTTVHCTYFYNPLALDAGLRQGTTPCTTLLRMFMQCSESVDVERPPPEQTDESCADRQRATTSASEPHHDVEVIPRSGHCLPFLETLVVSMGAPNPPAKEGKRKRRRPDLQPVLNAVRVWWDELVQVLSHRDSIGLRLKTLRIIGGWASEEVHRATAEVDAKMFAQAAELVDEILDERIVRLEFTYDSSRDFTQTFSSSKRAAVIPYNGAW